MKDGNQEYIQHDIADAAGDQDIKRLFGVACRPQDAGSHVVDHVGDHAAVKDPQIEQGICHGIFRCIQKKKGGSGGREAEYHDQGAAGYGKCHTRMNGFLQAGLIPGAAQVSDCDSST